MVSEKKDILDTIDSSNIFDEFETWELKEEFHTKKTKPKKDIYDYLSLAAGILSTLFWVGLFLIGGIFWYINIQENKELNSSSILNPVCYVMVWNTPLPDSSRCMSISAAEELYNNELRQLKNTQWKEILELLTEIYKIENFDKSKEVIFLQNRSKNRLKALTILNEFDKLRYFYDPINMQRIQCQSITLTGDLVLTTSCIAYSSDFTDDIRWFDGTYNQRITWTSISIANSFLNYIDKESQVFTLIDRQKSFTVEGFFSEYTNFSKKTSFNLTLQYNPTLTNK